jgi:outer membrane protein TolC
VSRARSSFAAALLGAALTACATPRDGEAEYVPAPLDAPPGAAAPVTSADPLEAGPRPALDLDACLRLARENSRRLSVAARRVLIADDRVDETIAGILPRLSAEGRFSARNNDAGVQRPGAPGISFQEREVGTASLSAIVPIYSFGRSSNRYDAATLGVEVAELEQTQAHQDLELAVRDAYFRLLEAQKIALVVEASLEVIDRQLEVARDFLAQDLVARSDVLAVEVQRAERQQESILAANNIDLATAVLNRLLGLPGDQRTAVQDVLEVVPVRTDLRDVLRLAIERRPDLEVARRRISIAQSQWRATRADFFPIIYAFGSYNYTSDEFQLNQDWLSGGAAIEWPIFDGGVTYTRLRRQEREIDEAIDLRDERLDDAVLEVRQAWLEQHAAAERVPVARKAIELADENLRIVRDQYGQGLVTSTDVLLEEDRLSRARSSHFRALYSYHQAHARLTHAIGGSAPGHTP